MMSFVMSVQRDCFVLYVYQHSFVLVTTLCIESSTFRVFIMTCQTFAQTFHICCFLVGIQTVNLRSYCVLIDTKNKDKVMMFVTFALHYFFCDQSATRVCVCVCVCL